MLHRKYSEIVESNKRWYLFRDVAVEFLFADKRNFLCVLKNKKERQAVLQRINGKIDPNAIKQSALGSFLLDTMQKAIDKAGTEIDEATHRWQHREISNVWRMSRIPHAALIRLSASVCVLASIEPIRESNAER
jgi:hypothetical protein